MNDPKLNPNPEPDRDSDNRQAITPSPSAGALTSLAALETALNSVDTASVVGRSGLPMMQFKSREGNGTWLYGQKKTIPEEGSHWAVSVLTFKHGYVCFNNANKVLGECLVSVSLPMPDITKLPDKGYEWQEQWAVNLKCISGTDAGTEVVFKTTTVGGLQAIAGLVDEVRNRLNGGEHDGKVSPIVRLEKGSYPHPQHGRIWTPLLTIDDWMPLNGPAPAPAPKSPPPAAAEQPRRRRVG